MAADSPLTFSANSIMATSASERPASRRDQCLRVEAESFRVTGDVPLVPDVVSIEYGDPAGRLILGWGSNNRHR